MYWYSPDGKNTTMSDCVVCENHSHPETPVDYKIVTHGNYPSLPHLSAILPVVCATYAPFPK
jgi:hypothetical protein